MGSSGVPLYDFLGFNFQRLVISSAKFDKLYFQDLLNKLNAFYYDYMLPKFCASGQLFCLLIIGLLGLSLHVHPSCKEKFSSK